MYFYKTYTMLNFRPNRRKVLRKVEYKVAISGQLNFVPPLHCNAANLLKLFCGAKDTKRRHLILSPCQNNNSIFGSLGRGEGSGGHHEVSSSGQGTNPLLTCWLSDGFLIPTWIAVGTVEQARL